MLASRAVDRVVVAVPLGWEARVRSLLDPRCDVVVGGDTRRASTLLALDAEIVKALDAVPKDRRRVVSTHDAFGYFSARYGIAFLAPQGVSTE